MFFRLYLQVIVDKYVAVCQEYEIPVDLRIIESAENMCEQGFSTAEACSLLTNILSICLTSKTLAVKGDPTCIYNARSRYLQCTVNPSGDCRDCPHFKIAQR